MQASTHFLAAYDQDVTRRALDASVREARERASQEISDQVTRDIAMVFRQQEAHDAHLEDLAALHRLVLELADGASLAGSERTQIAFQRARAQGNFSALEALQRELDRDREEEEHAVMMLLLN